MNSISTEVFDSLTLAQEGKEVPLLKALRHYQIVSLIDMINFKARRFFELAQILKDLQARVQQLLLSKKDYNEIIPASLKDYNASHLDGMTEICKEVGLEFSVMLLADIRTNLYTVSDYSYIGYTNELRELERRIAHEMSMHLFMVIPRSKSAYYTEKNLFGDEVADKFQEVNDDVERAGKCLATGNHTASVFHLMRVMEKGVQYLGAKLGVQVAEEKEWQTILNEVNKAIKTLSNPPTKMTPQMKKERDDYAAASERLQNVKDAWRNRVMHPKESYDEGEAEEVFNATKKFMQNLAAML